MRPPRRAHRALAAGGLAGGVAAAAALVGAVVALAAFQEAPDFRDSPFLRIDPEAVVLSERDSRVPCGECHTAEYEVWAGTAHATGFDQLHRSESAQDILESMDLTVTKRQESLCLRCHYTVDGSLRAIAGVSCESCHGPARDWMAVHNDLGPGVEHPDQETPEHREERIRASMEGGMLRPSGDLYAVAANCYECHTVPHEELVNTGGHRAGSAGFDLAERMADIRHNFLHQQWGGTEGNREPSPERTRMTFLTGRILAYEYALRGMAEATVEGSYHRSMERRMTGARRELEAVTRVVDVPEVVEILAVGRDLDPAPGRPDAFLEAADRVRQIAEGFTASRDGSELAGLDPLVRGEAAVAVSAEGPDPAAEPEPGRAPPVGGAPTGAATPSEGGAPAPPELPGRVRSRPAWFPDPGPYEVLDEDCARCHRDAEEWWFEDAHFEANLRLVNQEPRAAEIATLYGIPPSAMARGDRMCASCHGLVPSAAPSVDVFTGVGCESCHGPSSGFLDPHEDGGNPQLGMRALKEPAVRAANCARCHHISDERLLAAGHPSGQGYDFVAANRAIVHYPDERNVQRGRDERGEGAYPAVSDAALASAWQVAVAARPVPDVPVFDPPDRPPAPPDTVGSDGPPPASGEPRGGPRPTPPPPPSSLTLEPFPERVDTLSTEDLLLLVRQRLEALYRALGRGR